jgi:hypothetical protein
VRIRGYFSKQNKVRQQKQVWETLTGLKDKGDDHFIMSNAEDFVGAFIYSRKAPTKFTMCVCQFGFHLKYFSEIRNLVILQKTYREPLS